MRLNTIKPAPGAQKKKQRVGRGIGSGSGKTCGLGHKGQRSRSGGSIPIGFEGGQMPFQRRIPKFGFTSRKAKRAAEVRLSELNCFTGEEAVDLALLKKTNIIPRRIKQVKIIASGSVEKALTIRGLAVTKGAKAAIEQAGGKIVES